MFLITFDYIKFLKVKVLLSNVEVVLRIFLNMAVTNYSSEYRFCFRVGKDFFKIHFSLGSNEGFYIFVY